MAHRISLLFLSLAAPAMLLTFVWAGPWSELLLLLLASAFPVALIALGAARGGRLGPLRWPLLLLLLLLIGTMLGMWVLRGQVLEAPWLGGLPLAAALQLLGLFLLPLLAVALTYAWTFERWGLRDEDLARLQDRFPPPKSRP